MSRDSPITALFYEHPQKQKPMRSPAGLRNPERQRTLTSTLSFRVMYPEP